MFEGSFLLNWSEIWMKKGRHKEGWRSHSFCGPPYSPLLADRNFSWTLCERNNRASWTRSTSKTNRLKTSPLYQHCPLNNWTIFVQLTKTVSTLFAKLQFQICLNFPWHLNFPANSNEQIFRSEICQATIKDDSSEQECIFDTKEFEFHVTIKFFSCLQGFSAWNLKLVDHSE